MHHPFYIAFISTLAALTFSASGWAQVYQCTDASGKKVFSQTPCAAAGSNGEKLIVRAPGPAPAAVPTTSAEASFADGVPFKGVPGVLYGNDGAAKAPKDWAAENAAANARANAQASSNSQANYPPLGGLRKNTPATARKTDQQVVSECEASHGARCASTGEINQRRMEQRTLTPAEQRQQQDAVAARRQRAQDEEFFKRR
ncbi:MAG: DUF4124 domain-containing protein [Polaromonas sp.]|uniref:DUF4124 domain-containing protein n=1 Tax=Polaromonas sp. TaxID=1869339 RepID=UPI0032678C37